MILYGYTTHFIFANIAIILTFIKTLLIRLILKFLFHTLNLGHNI